MIYESYLITEKEGFYSVTIDARVYTRAKLSNIKTIIHAWNAGMKEYVRGLQSTRVEWVTNTTETGYRKDPKHPDIGIQKGYEEAFGSPEWGTVGGITKPKAEIERRARQLDKVDWDKYEKDRVMFPWLKMPKIKLPGFPSFDLGFGTPAKIVGTLIILFVAMIVVLVALGYSGLGGAAGSRLEK